LKAYSKHLVIFSTINRVPLHMFLFLFIFLITIIGIPTFKRNSYRGKPGTSSVFKNSIGTSGFSSEGVGINLVKFGIFR